MKLLKDGKSVIAMNLSGVQKPLNGMYITYGLVPDAEPPDADFTYFQNLKSIDGRGFIRLSTCDAKFVPDDKVMFTGMITPEILQGHDITSNTMLTTVTMVHLGDTPAKDLFVYSTVLAIPLKIVPGTFIVVNASFRIGD